MAQDFESEGGQITNSATTLLTANSDDAIVGLRLANITANAVTVSVFILEDTSSAPGNNLLASSLQLEPRWRPLQSL